MAGIGFQLRKILSEDTYTGHLKAYVFAAIISSGPWMMTIFSISMITQTCRSFLTDLEADIFGATINYTYAFSLIFVGFLQLVVTRYLADRLYRAETHMVLPIFNTTLAVTLVSQGFTACVFYYFCDVDLAYGLGGTLLYMTVCSLWICMIFLSAAKDYGSIVYAFLAGSVLSVIGARMLSGTYGLTGVLIGYASGQMFTLFWLFHRMLAEFPSDRATDWDVFRSFNVYWELILVGFLYNIGIWADKFIMWYAGPGYLVHGLFYANRIYDSSIFFAYVVTLPAFALFLIRVETDFYDHYKQYYAAIIHKAPRSKVLENRDNLTASLRNGFGILLEVQIVIALAAIVFTPNVIDILHFSFLQFSIMRVGVLASLLQAIYLMLLVVLMYFDFRREALITTVVFLTTNTVFTFATVRLGFPTYGYGYFASCFVTVPVAYFLLDKNLRRLEYLTFMKQPILTHAGRIA